eukprot:SAG31_NODE_7038_length_1807_cov_16.190867_1_plen_66_part_00
MYHQVLNLNLVRSGTLEYPSRIVDVDEIYILNLVRSGARVRESTVLSPRTGIFKKTNSIDRDSVP